MERILYRNQRKKIHYRGERSSILFRIFIFKMTSVFIYGSRDISMRFQLLINSRQRGHDKNGMQEQRKSKPMVIRVLINDSFPVTTANVYVAGDEIIPTRRVYYTRVVRRKILFLLVSAITTPKRSRITVYNIIGQQYEKKRKLSIRQTQDRMTRVPLYTVRVKDQMRYAHS